MLTGIDIGGTKCAVMISDGEKIVERVQFPTAAVDETLDMLEQTVEKLGCGEAVTAKALAEAAQKGDSLAIEAYRICGTMLGRGLSILVDLLNPECIVIGSVYARSGVLLQDAMEDVLCREALPSALEVCRIVPAALGDRVGDYAAIAVAAEAAKGGK